jgi:excisionase family DNA binding protein
MPHDEVLLIGVREAARRTSMGVSRCYRLIRLGQFPGAIRVGGTWRISVPALEAWVERSVSEGPHRAAQASDSLAPGGLAT